MFVKTENLSFRVYNKALPPTTTKCAVLRHAFYKCHKGKRILVDSLTQTVEFVGSGQERVEAYCEARRDALNP